MISSDHIKSIKGAPFLLLSVLLLSGCSSGDHSESTSSSSDKEKEDQQVTHSREMD
ncbi:hypothetical protein [Halobacillus naozhouensis]|uniref:Uncharacterized protein n=1 Tax=Halobacillus naozhouensis TaxID=554880 RepID=A0ABY8IXW1_9BACI|nr:hypothetical protein [Halobacillus naozhouensis]WFT74134.1 hypothetical protein P9989_17450 [Halobacillus naozhouensis]